MFINYKLKYFLKMKIKFKNIGLHFLVLSNILILFLIGIFLFPNNIKTLAATGTSDAVAIRVVSNPDHISAQDWYEQQKFLGSPQSLTVDGYKAVRDGRTVYVSATNIVNEGSTNYLYSNIYLISYNQSADSQTVDIFGQILKNWKFNTNLTDIVGSCTISSKSCYEQSDCLEGYICSNNKCVLPAADNLNCILDSECPTNLFCDGKKAKIIRDLDRLEKIVAIKNALSEYYNKTNHYPVLGSGTYLSHIALSSWPSWQNAFLNELAIDGISDPINKLGSCGDAEKKFDIDTCWNASSNSFLSTTTSYNSENFALPNSSYIITYLTNNNGSDYNLCAVMETAMDGIDYKLASSSISNYSCGVGSSAGNASIIGNIQNKAPYISEYSLSGISGQELQGFIKAIDPEGNTINWQIINSNFTGWGANPTPTLINSGEPNQKMLWADKAGAKGTYPITVKLTDKLGSSTTQTLNLVISNPGPQIIAGNVSHNLSYSPSFTTNITIKSLNDLQNTGNIKNIRINYSYNQSNYNIAVPECPNYSFTFNNQFKACYDKITDKEVIVKISGLNNNLSVGNYTQSIFVCDQYNECPEKEFTISLTANKPVISFDNCLKIASLGDNYECKLDITNIIESSNTVVNFSTSSLGLSFDSGTKKISGKLSGLGDINITATTTNQFGLSTTKNYNLKVITDCGTALVKYEGGPWNFDGTMRNGGGYYKTLLIGNKCWLGDNLNIGTFAGNAATTTNDSVIEKYCYGNNQTNCDIYGGLYQWNEAMNYSTVASSKGICPDGWHIPSAWEWQTYLFDTVKNQGHGCNYCTSGSMGTICLNYDGYNIARALASKSGWGQVWIWDALAGKEVLSQDYCLPGVNPQDNNITGFNWMPSGYRGAASSTFYSIGDWAPIWTSREYQEPGLLRAQCARIRKDLATSTSDGVDYKSTGNAVRCIKD
jgi:uncharacterized protein (TIGR02145 family)